MKPESFDEKQLVKEFKSGNRSAFDTIVEHYSGKLYQAAYGLLSNQQDAEEVVQDAFVRAFKAMDSFRGDSSLDTWLHRIVINLARNKYHWNRRRGSQVNVSISDQSKKLDDERTPEDMHIPDESYGPDNMLEKAEFENEIIKSFDKLPETLKETMVLRHINEMPYEEIAEVLKCKIGTVKSRIARGREILKKILLG